MATQSSGHGTQRFIISAAINNFIMRQIRSFVLPPVRHAKQTGTALLAAGLAMLLVAASMPGMPAVSAMAMVALGATMVTIDRFRGTAALRASLAAHLVVYSSLYFLFVGAVCHAAMAGPQDGLTFLQGLDFGISATLMTFVVRMGVRNVGPRQRLPWSLAITDASLRPTA